MPTANLVQNKACLNLPINSPFRGLPNCFQCEHKVGQAVRTKLCRRIFVEDNVTLCSGEVLSPVYPSSWDRRPTVSEARRSLRQITEILLPVLKAELCHTEEDGTLWFRRELMERVSCDRCATSLFAGAFICEHCGREWCSNCYPKSSPACPGHITRLRRVSRFQDRDEIVTTIAKMEELVKNVRLPVPPEGNQHKRGYITLHSPTDGYPARRDFMDCLRRGAPLVVKGSDGLLQRKYDFNYFAQALSGQKIKVIHVQDPAREEMKDAHEFFKRIATNVHRDEVDLYKIKDFPPRNAFKEFLEPLAHDLEQHWPFRSYIALCGVMNLLARMPINKGIPKIDVGPKLYNSPGIPKSYKKASTALHMDLMDAINVSLSADESDSSNDPVAVWHIFASHDCAKLRTYLNTKYEDDPDRPEGDLIHSQCVFFTDEMLEELEKQTGVRPWVIHQAPGDAVFIPSRCPHQVRNCVWTLKTAIDFLSGEALPRTAEVAEELRMHRLVDKNSEDVLQLHLVLWHAWVSLNNEMPDVVAMEKLQNREKRKAKQQEGRRGTGHPDGTKKRRSEAAVQ